MSVSPGPRPRYGHKVKPIAVGDEVKTRYVKTDDYWLAKVLAVEDDGVTVQCLVEVGPSAPAKVPLGHVLALGADGGYGDGCSALGAASSSKAVGSKRKRAALVTTNHGGARLGAGGRYEKKRSQGVDPLVRHLT